MDAENKESCLQRDSAERKGYVRAHRSFNRIRRSIIELLKDWGYKVHEERVAIADIMKAADEGKLEEVFGTGTAAVVSPVKELDWEGKVAHISGGHIGELTQKLYDTLTGIQWGKLPDTKGWIVPVE